MGLGGNATDPDLPPDEVELSWISVLFAGFLIVINITLSVRLSLGLTSKLVVSGIRCVVQLAAIGVILELIFNVGTGNDGPEAGETGVNWT